MSRFVSDSAGAPAEVATLRSGGWITHTVWPGQRLVLTADAGTGHARQIETNPGEAASGERTEAPAGRTEIGPFPERRVYRVECETGSMVARVVGSRR